MLISTQFSRFRHQGQVEQSQKKVSKSYDLYQASEAPIRKVKEMVDIIKCAVTKRPMAACSIDILIPCI